MVRMRILIVFSILPTLFAETHTLTLAQAMQRAREQNPDVLLARLDQRKAADAVRIQQDPFHPKVFAGSGLAYTSGFPMSIEGSAPSVVQARAVASVYDRSQRFKIAEAKENVRGAGISVEARAEEVVVRTVELYLDAAHAARSAVAARDQADSSARLEGFTKTRVEEGREIPLEARKAALDTARAKQMMARYEANARVLEATLAEVLGYPAGDEVRPSTETTVAPELPTEAAAIEAAYRASADLRRMDSDMAAKQLSIRSAQSARWPKLNLVAQYGLFAKFNNYEQFFKGFQRHNGQLGVSLEVPVWMGPAAKAVADQAQADTERLRIEANRLRTRLALDIRRDYSSISEAELARDVARLDLDVAREALEVTRARVDEGRAALRDVEMARQLEAQKWLAYYDAVHTLDRARYGLAARAGLLKTP
jgi:outer membrane protein